MTEPKGGYVLVQNQKKSLTNSEILTVCKILLESRALVREEMHPIIDKLLQCCVPYGSYKKVADLIGNEKFHYLEPHHGKKFVDTMWDISSAFVVAVAFNGERILYERKGDSYNNGRKKEMGLGMCFCRCMKIVNLEIIKEEDYDTFIKGVDGYLEK